MIKIQGAWKQNKSFKHKGTQANLHEKYHHFAKYVKCNENMLKNIFLQICIVTPYMFF